MSRVQKLKKLLRDRGLSGAEIARRIDLSASQVSRDLAGYEMSDERLHTYLKLLDLSVDEFNNGVTEKSAIHTDKETSYLRVLEEQSRMITMLMEELAEYRREIRELRSQSESQ